MEEEKSLSELQEEILEKLEELNKAIERIIQKQMEKKDANEKERLQS